MSKLCFIKYEKSHWTIVFILLMLPDDIIIQLSSILLIQLMLSDFQKPPDDIIYAILCDRGRYYLGCEISLRTVLSMLFDASADVLIHASSWEVCLFADAGMFLLDINLFMCMVFITGRS